MDRHNDDVAVKAAVIGALGRVWELGGGRKLLRATPCPGCRGTLWRHDDSWCRRESGQAARERDVRLAALRAKYAPLDEANVARALDVNAPLDAANVAWSGQ